MLLRILLLLSIILPTVAHSQTGNFQPDMFEDSSRLQRIEKAFPVIRKMYEEFATRNHVPGLAFGIVSGGKLIYSGAFGFTDVDKQVPVTASSVFRIASMSKSFTAMAILKLRDEGKLKLDDAVSKYIPELKKTRSLTSDAPPITIRNLLSHTAGFPEDNPWGDRQLARSTAEFETFLKNGLSLANVPGRDFEYSNLGFALLGHIITKISGQSFENYIATHIWKPLGMTHSYWEYAKVPQDKLAHGYRRVNGQWQQEQLLHDGVYGAMGGMLTSIEDFSKYMQLHLAAWPPANDQQKIPLKRASIREMHSSGPVAGVWTADTTSEGRPCAVAMTYFCGLGSTRDCNGRVMVSHSGGLPGFGSNWVILPSYDLGIVSFTNLTYTAPSNRNIIAADSIISIAGLSPRKVQPSLILKQRQQQLVQLLPGWEGAEQSGLFAENFFKDYYIDSLRANARVLFAEAGAIKNVSEITPVNQLRGKFLLKGEKADLEVWFTLTPEKNAVIQEYDLTVVKKK